MKGDMLLWSLTKLHADWSRGGNPSHPDGRAVETDASTQDWKLISDVNLIAHDSLTRKLQDLQ
jgi:hypothetical protein